MLVAGAFRTAYAHSQSPLTGTRHCHAAIDTQPAQQSQPPSSDDLPWRPSARHAAAIDTQPHAHQQQTSDVITVRATWGDVIVVEGFRHPGT